MIGCPTCNKCGVDLDDTNWYPSSKKYNAYRCKTCVGETSKKWVEENTDKRRCIVERCGRKIGILPMRENRGCSKFLGIHVAERVLRHVFKDVEVMPSGNAGFDFICNKGKKIDVKSSCRSTSEKYSDFWSFAIKKNTNADYFLCLAFDDRINLNPLHVWMIHGHVLNYKTGTTISETKLGKWAEYELGIGKILSCCDILKDGSQ